MYNNNKYKTKYDTNHSVNDTNKCASLRKKVNNLISNSNYKIMPVVPNYLGSFNINKNNKNNVFNKQAVNIANSCQNITQRRNDRSNDISTIPT